jgi:hypothetical protein
MMASHDYHIRLCSLSALALFAFFLNERRFSLAILKLEYDTPIL